MKDMNKVILIYVNLFLDFPESRKREILLSFWLPTTTSRVASEDFSWVNA